MANVSFLQGLKKAGDIISDTADAGDPIGAMGWDDSSTDFSSSDTSHADGSPSAFFSNTIDSVSTSGDEPYIVEHSSFINEDQFNGNTIRRIALHFSPAAPAETDQTIGFGADGFNIPKTNAFGFRTFFRLKYGDNMAQVVRHTTVTLTSAQVLALNSSPAQIIAAPGAGRLLKFLDGIAALAFGTAAYTDGGGVFLLYDADQTRVSASGPNVGWYADTEDVVANLINDNVSYPRAAVENKGIFAATDVSDPSGGDGTITISVLYAIIDLTTGSYVTF